MERVMKMINIKYDKDTHYLQIKLFKRFIISINHGVPGDWFFFSNEDGFKITTPVGFVTGYKRGRIQSSWVYTLYCFC